MTKHRRRMYRDGYVFPRSEREARHPGYAVTVYRCPERTIVGPAMVLATIALGVLALTGALK